MNKDKKNIAEEKRESESEMTKRREEEIDEQLKQTFPASDPPSYSKPGNYKKDRQEL